MHLLGPRSVCKRAKPIGEFAEKLIANPLFAYSIITILQLRVIWNIWRNADLTSGDTSFYFVDAASWAHGFHEDILFYPLYDVFWGTILAVVHSIYASMVIQRATIILGVTLLVLAVMRILLGPVIGLLIAIWWAVLPATAHVLYEIHLFGAVPVLIVALVVARMPRREGIGIALAILFGSAVLIRNELLLSGAFLGLATAIYELREIYRRNRPKSFAYLRAYGIPLAVLCLVLVGTYDRSYIQGEAAVQQLNSKEANTFSQYYAISYEEEYPTRYTGNPWIDYQPLMEQKFHQQEPTWTEAIVANPTAVAGFVLWDARLLPAGIQVALFGASSFSNDPGAIPVKSHSTYPVLLSVVLLLIMALGLATAVRQGKLSLRRAPPRTRWLLVALGSIGLADALVVLTTRPWSDYMFGIMICMMILVGAAVLVLVRRVGGERLLAVCALVAILLLIAMVPSEYGPGPRPIYDGIQHLELVQDRLQQPGSVLVSGALYNILCNYLAYSHERECTGVYWPSLQPEVTSQTSVGKVLDRAHATVVYADAGLMADPMIAKLVADPEAQGWKQIAHGAGPDGPWSVLIPCGSPDPSTDK